MSVDPPIHSVFGVEKRPITVRVARWSAEHPWRAIALWVVFVAVCFAAGTWAGTNTASDKDMAQGESARATEIVDSGDFDDPAEENVLNASRAVTARATRIQGVIRGRGIGDPGPLGRR